MTDSAGEHLEAVLAALLAAYGELDQDAKAAGSDEEVARRATRLLEALREPTTQTARWRAPFVKRWKRDSGLSYAQIARHLGLSKEAVVKIVKLAEKLERGDT